METSFLCTVCMSIDNISTQSFLKGVRCYSGMKTFIVPSCNRFNYNHLYIPSAKLLDPPLKSALPKNLTAREYIIIVFVCLFVCLFVICLLGIYPSTREFSPISRRHHCRWRATNFDLFSALIVIEQWEFFNLPRLLWHG